MLAGMPECTQPTHGVGIQSSPNPDGPLLRSDTWNNGFAGKEVQKLLLLCGIWLLPHIGVDDGHLPFVGSAVGPGFDASLPTCETAVGIHTCSPPQRIVKRKKKATDRPALAVREHGMVVEWNPKRGMGVEV